MDIAICAIGYNRVESMKRLLGSLARGFYPEDGGVTLYISVDKSDSDAVAEYGDSFEWKHGPKKVLRHPENLSLRKHILSCGDLLEHHDALIVLEDDIVVAPAFYQYAQQTVAKYHDNPEIAGISLYNFPLNYQNRLPFHPLQSASDVFLMQSAMSWGQVWLKQQWRAFRAWYDSHNEEFGEQSHLPIAISRWPKSSWLKYHMKYCIEERKYFIYPYVSLSTCFADAGVHVDKSNTYFQSYMLEGECGELRLNPTIKYDGFFECENIYGWLGMDSSELCIDFYGEKGNREGKRFWLTRRLENYKCINSYALQLKPYPLNIQCQIPGEEIFLYDTSLSDTSPAVSRKILGANFIKYLYGRRIDVLSEIYKVYITVISHIKKLCSRR